MIGLRSLAFLGASLLIAGCAGQLGTVPSRSPRSVPDTRARAVPAAPPSFRWSLGQTFTAAVSFEEEDQGAVVDELHFTAQEQFRVLRDVGGTATIQAGLTAWRWQRNTSALLTTSLPGSTTFGVNAAGETVAGVDWPLPSELPLPGLDIFASPLGHPRGWSRTDGEGVGLVYQLRGPATGAQATLTWSVERPQFTRSGDPITVDGRGAVTVVSSYRVLGRTLSLRSTREQGAFQRSTRSAAGTTQESGTVLETTTFSGPSP
jgi:hypothetical protein